MEKVITHNYQLLYTKEEWEFLERMANGKGKKDFIVFLRQELHRLAELDIQHLSCSYDNTKIRRGFKIPERISDNILSLSERMNIPFSSVINRMIIHPELRLLYDNPDLK